MHTHITYSTHTHTLTHSHTLTVISPSVTYPLPLPLTACEVYPADSLWSDHEMCGNSFLVLTLLSLCPANRHGHTCCALRCERGPSVVKREHVHAPARPSRVHARVCRQSGASDLSVGFLSCNLTPMKGSLSRWEYFSVLPWLQQLHS